MEDEDLVKLPVVGKIFAAFDGDENDPKVRKLRFVGMACVYGIAAVLVLLTLWVAYALARWGMSFFGK